MIVNEGHMSGTQEARRVALESWNVNEACIGAGLSKVGTAEPIKHKLAVQLIYCHLCAGQLKERCFFFQEHLS